MNGPILLVLLCPLACAAFGLHMVLHPEPYLNKGTAPVADPRVFRALGLFLIVLGAATLAFILTQSVTE
ncbi:MAG: hypothetical protein V4574_04580 [Pseudomonadota bacterium]